VTAALVLAIIYSVWVLAFRWVKRRRRRQRATTADARVEVAWDESVEAMAVVGMRPRVSETHAEFASRADTVVREVGYPTLASSVEAARYSRDGVDDELADEAMTLSEGIQTTVRERATRGQRVRASLDPRPLLPRRLQRFPRRRRPVDGADDRMRVTSLRR
jgi:hypothetical protein